jgi:hypothetical protein
MEKREKEKKRKREKEKKRKREKEKKTYLGPKQHQTRRLGPFKSPPPDLTLPPCPFKRT